MEPPSPFACVLVGEESLLVQCAEQLHRRVHTVHAVVSDAEVVRVWAEREGVRLVSPAPALAEALSDVPCDVLFSIANLRVLSPEVLRIARREAINFHDGPLPDYAGLNVPSWALLNGEREHAVTWHRMVESVDQGAVLAEERFPIAPDETALSLNVKCYEAALASFDRLLTDLERGALAPRQQIGTSTLYRRHQRPPAGAVLDWTQPASDLDRIVRALDFGKYRNPLALPKIATPSGRIFFVRAARVEPEAGAPGLIIRVDAAGLVVAAGEESLAVTRLVDEAGEQVEIEVLAQAGVVEGAVLPVLAAEVKEVLTDQVQAAARHETFWQKRWAEFEQLDLPYIRRATGVGERLKQPMDALVGSLGSEAFVAAFGLYLARLLGREAVTVGVRMPVLDSPVPDIFVSVVPLHLTIAPDILVGEAFGAAQEAVSDVSERGSFTRDLGLRMPELASVPLDYEVVLDLAGDLTPDVASLVIHVGEDGQSTWDYDSARFDEAGITAMQRQLERIAEQLGAQVQVADLDLLNEQERRRLLEAWNATDREGAFDRTISELFEAQADRTPDAAALQFHNTTWTYADLDAQANRIAHRLQRIGVERGDRVGVGTKRSPEMVATLLGVLKAGAAYVPLDPTYPADRLEFMVEDAGLAALVFDAEAPTSLPAGVPTVAVADALDEAPADRLALTATASDLAYVLYTSGSTGRPKGVMVEHRNVVSFFVGMDEVMGPEPGTWLAVTSISFDISVLELLWTLTRGYTVVVQPEGPEVPSASARSAGASKQLGFSLFYFSSDEGSGDASEKYRLLLDGARFADAHGFEAVWTPERHFHAFGGLYPNPAVTSAALAAITQRVALRAGSCVSPLHETPRIAEEWSVVDNLSGGRVGISFAAGWQPNDFVLKPDRFAESKRVMLEQIEEVRALWRGEARSYLGPKGEPVEIRTLPRPVQPELPVWLTAAANPDTFRTAGAQGYFLLTHLLGQSVEELEEKIRIYRDAWAEAGHPGEGHVTLMLHTFVGDDDEVVREQVREPMKAYLRSSIGLIKAAAWSFPTFKQKTTDANGQFSLRDLSETEMEDVLEFSFERYFETSALFGSIPTCLRTVDRVRTAGVDEVACLIDFGVDTDTVLDHLPLLNRLRVAAEATSISGDGQATGEPAVGTMAAETIPELIARYGVTHLQCTPSQASLIVAEPEGAAALASLDHLLLGGEALPASLTDRIRAAGPARITNMYGPTETTIWSTTHEVGEEVGVVSIGRPIANTRVYVLDDAQRPVPIGVAGELYVGGMGVTRGYLHRPELTAERYLPDPFQDGGRMYRTGDLARWRGDGVLEFLGRNDFQVKLRGYRIELGEIEGALLSHPSITEAAVVVREVSEGDERLVAFVSSSGPDVSVASLRGHLRERLPDYMVPAHIVSLAVLPKTPNQKVDRKALQPIPLAPPPPVAAAPTTVPTVSEGGHNEEVEHTLTAIWRDVLGVETVGPTDNFFDLGGHSLLAMQVQARIRTDLNQEVGPVALFRYPTVRAFAGYLAGKAEEGVQQGQDRGANRRAALLGRRRQ